MTINRDPFTQTGQKVNAAGEALVSATTKSEMETVSETDGDAYSWSNLTYDYTALDTILLVKNTGSNELHIQTIWVSVDAATEVVVHVPTTTVTSPTGTAVVGVNLNTASGKTADATAIAGETTNSRGGVVFAGLIAANDIRPIPLGGALIIAPNDSIAVDFVDVGAKCNVVIFGYFHNSD